MRYPILLTMLVTFSTSAFLCQGDDALGTYDDTLDELEMLIQEEVGEAKASELSQCKSTAFGSKPCGGPWSYLVYSVTDSDESHLLNLVDRYNDFELELNQREDRSSDCSVIFKPHLMLTNNRCEAVIL